MWVNDKMNKKQIGDKRENEVYKILRDKNWIINPAPRTMRRIFSKGKIFFVSQRNDHWGLFDGTARNDQKKVLHFQVKSDSSDVSKAKKGIEEFYDKYCSNYEFCEIWLRVKKKGFIIYGLEYNSMGSVAILNGKENYEFGKFLWNKRYINLKGEECPEFKIKERVKEDESKEII